MNNVFLLTGGNLGNRLENLKKACEAVALRIGEIVNKSSVYETAAWGLTGQPDFLNQVLVVATTMSPEEILSTVLTIESEMGRVRLQKMGARTIDIDILFYEDIILNSTNLVIPHQEIAKRRFVLIPMFEMNKSFVHPVLKKTIATLLDECPDELAVRLHTPA